MNDLLSYSNLKIKEPGFRAHQIPLKPGYDISFVVFIVAVAVAVFVAIFCTFAS